jgi:hypothetical protein
VIQGDGCKEHCSPAAQAYWWRDFTVKSIAIPKQQIAAGYCGHSYHYSVKHDKDRVLSDFLVHDSNGFLVAKI